MSINNIKIPVLLGPTAAGKTELALRLAEEMGWEILSCDSRQIYRYMNIGTAKPTPAQLQTVKHWLIDILDPSQTYSAFQFAREAEDIIRNSGKTVLICGGTGLYFRSLSEGFGMAIESDPVIRDELMQKAKSEGNASLYEELQSKDPVSAARLHANDLQRVVRALAVYYQTGTPISNQMQDGSPPEGLEFITVKLSVDRGKLYRQIDGRVESMINAGLWEEFLKLLESGFDEKTPGMQCVGYRELFALQRGDCSLRSAIEKIQRNTRRFAKRQVTWLTHQTAGIEFDVRDEYENLRAFYLKQLG